MSDAGEPRYLRSNTIIEPLTDRFHAWLHTVAPVQAAMNLAFMQVPLLESYIENPRVHINAAESPDPHGGHFVGVDEDRKGEVGDLIASIKRDRAGMLGFAAAVAEGAALLRESATGFDLTPLYPKLPAALNGLVEMAYDTGNQPSMHFLDPVVYRSEVYDVARQSVQLSTDRGARRPSILSTPRLPGADVLDLPLAFGHPGLAELAKAGIAPTTLARLREVLELDDARAALLGGLLDAQPSLSADRQIEAGGRIRYFGHACLVLQTPQATIVTDPFISTDTCAGGRYTLDDLPDHIDLVLITQGHPDHLVLETLLRLRGRVGAVVVPRSSKAGLCDPSIGTCLTHLGLPAIEVDDFSEVPFPGGKVTATPFLGAHSDLDIRAKSTYWVELAGKKVFVGADSPGIDPLLYRHIREHLGQADMAFLGMNCDAAPVTWLYQALLTVTVSKKMSRSRTLSASNAAQAAAITTELGAAQAYVYSMGEESWQQHVTATAYSEDTFRFKQVEEFLGWCADRGIGAERLADKREWRW
jgi:L-ascorbate metabolism protein UlaG (beta-lactamase superfamily)